LERIELPEPEGEPSDEWIQPKVLVYLGVLAGRSRRGVVVALRSGYDPEALVLKRRLDEITARVKRVADAEHGAQNAGGRGADRAPRPDEPGGPHLVARPLRGQASQVRPYCSDAAA
jgi:hypothetical protein